MSGDEHKADRPSWDCGTCGAPWPCEPAREQIIAEHGAGTRLVLWMSIDMIDAARENPGLLPGQLYERFISWTR
jgi:hypothetical protein